MDSPYHYLEKIEDLKEKVRLAHQAVKDAVADVKFGLGTVADVEAAAATREAIVFRCEAEIRNVYPHYLEEVRVRREKAAQ